MSMKRGGNKETVEKVPGYLLQNCAIAARLEQVVLAWMWFFHIVERHKSGVFINHPEPLPEKPFGHGQNVAYQTMFLNPAGYNNDFKRKLVVQLLLGEDYKINPSLVVTLVGDDGYDFLRVGFCPARSRSQWAFTYRARANGWAANAMNLKLSIKVIDSERWISKKNRDKAFTIMLDAFVAA